MQGPGQQLECCSGAPKVPLPGRPQEVFCNPARFHALKECPTYVKVLREVPRLCCSMGTLLRTLALVKPDAVRLGRALDIRQRAELEGFTVLAQERIQARAQRRQGCQSTFFVMYADSCPKLCAADAQPRGGFLRRPRGELTQAALVSCCSLQSAGAWSRQRLVLTFARALVLCRARASSPSWSNI